MLFILKSDFNIQIPTAQLDKLTGAIDSIWQAEVQRSIELISSYLRARYDVDAIFIPFSQYAIDVAYAIDDRVLWTVEKYASSNSYDEDELCSYNDKIYQSKEDAVTGVWDSSKWTYLAENNSKYVCIKVGTGKLPSETDYFTEGDPRNQDLLGKLIDVILYNIYSRLNSVDIPDIRKERYDGNDSRQTGGAIGWLKQIVRGYLEPDLPLNETNQDDQTGNKVIFGYASTIVDNKTTF
jgi:hypothetical protein